MIRRHPWKTGICIGTLGGALVAAAAMYAAWQHNPQGEIYDESGVDWGYWLVIGVSWFLPTTFVLSIGAGVVLRIAASIRVRDAA
jgi:hypothetical protein